MATIVPFKAIRPTRDIVSLMATRSYESYSLSERNARMKTNPFSFLHIINPGFRYHRKTAGGERYRLVRNRYLEFKEDGYLKQDVAASFYVYQINNREGQHFRGIIAAASVQDYLDDVIKKHEDTITSRETLFKDYLHTVGFNAEPVLLMYPDNDFLEGVMDAICEERPDYEFTTTYRDTHYLWPVTDPKTIATITETFKHMPELHIADGHHRSASSVRLSQEMSKTEAHADPKSTYHYFMSYLIPEKDLRIYAFNRLVKDLNGHSKESFLIALDALFRIEDRGTTFYKPSKKHHFSMYLDGEYYSLYLRQLDYDFANPLEALDTHILYKTILHPILGIENPRTDKRLSYTTGKEAGVGIKAQVDSGRFKVAFSMLPIQTWELKEVANAGLQMPPKSTYIVPKLRSGITIYEF
ncbi:MAG: DUF1015 domain-containing protein [Gilvibacter sp.]